MLLFTFYIINSFLYYVKFKNKIDFIIYLCYIILIIKYTRFTPDNYIIVIGLFLCY
nr:MAG TPA: hypothetical protein [Bacteriophage sp.]